MMTMKALTLPRFDPAVVAVRMLNNFPLSAHEKVMSLRNGYPEGEALHTYWDAVMREVERVGVAHQLKIFCGKEEAR